MNNTQNFIWYNTRAYNDKNSVVRDKMSELEQEGWIDRYTRAVFVEFTVYNPGVNLFAVSTMLAEFRPSQGIVPSYRFEPVMLFPYMNLKLHIFISVTILEHIG
jgi:hypothetical protein